RHILATEGIGRLSIDRVAERAGVGKPTIYRSWANAQELAMAAFMQEPMEQPQPSRSRSLTVALVHHLTAMSQSFNSARGRQITLMMAAADPGSELAKAFRNQVIQQSRRTGALLIERGVQSGELRRPPDMEVALDMIYGPIFYRLLAGHASFKAEFISALVEMLFRGLRSGDE
ncbi:MAG: TetR/AcrR family transcriptional regulator, partial [Aquabacterium sp.]